MRARISATGKLTVTPENETESWALRCWFLAYEHKQGESVTLCVEDIVLTPTPQRSE